MSAAMTRIHFSWQVENAMRKNNEEMTVDLCHDSRLWLCAEDDPGIPALERIKIGVVLHNRQQKMSISYPTVYKRVSLFTFGKGLWQALMQRPRDV